MPEPIRVIKVGGSLLIHADLSSTLESWLARQPEAVNVCVVGGGEPVDQIRREQIRIHQEDEEAHWTSIDRMVSNAIEMAHKMGAEIKSCCQDVIALSSTMTQSSAQSMLGSPGTTLFFDVGQWLRERTEPLPQDWSVTSDSIAAALAIDLEADELVLLKSRDSDPAATFEQLASQGIVDDYFPSLADQIPAVRCDNLLRGWLED